MHRDIVVLTLLSGLTVILLDTAFDMWLHHDIYMYCTCTWSECELVHVYENVIEHSLSSLYSFCPYLSLSSSLTLPIPTLSLHGKDFYIKSLLIHSLCLTFIFLCKPQTCTAIISFVR